jgi:serine/threonine protein kinase HipA of HipAB toxin-antitoxin module
MQERLLRLLHIEGPSAAPALTAALGISQPTFSRLVRGAGDAVIFAGNARARRYAARRRIDGVAAPVPVSWVDGTGNIHSLCTLDPVHPGFYVRTTPPESAEAPWTPGLPWFLQDARPSGFLGRLIPRRHPTLGLPPDIRLWSDDHVMTFITRFGDDLLGQLVVGDEAAQAVLQYDVDAENGAAVDVADYPRLAAVALDAGMPGSSAGGEQPKFMATRRTTSGEDGAGRAVDERVAHVIVKWSPPVHSDVGRRVSDLLVAEHLALESLSALLPTARTRIVQLAERTFLEVERFDRVGATGRRGMVSFATLNTEYGENDSDGAEGWSQVAAMLHRQKVIDDDALRGARTAALFGGLIANTDMHLHNLSCAVDILTVTGLAPIYDMLPMRYAPVGGEIVARAPAITAPLPHDADIAADVVAAADDFWARVAADARISDTFRSLAGEHRRLVRRLRGRHAAA